MTQTDTKVVWCDQEICEEREADGATVTRRSFASAEQVGSAPRFFVTDHLGSVTDVTDGSATALARYGFDPWGRRSLSAGTDAAAVGFTSHRWNADADAWFTLYRAYDPNMGRWLSEDPGGLAGGINAYAYVNGAPVNEYDEFGLVSSKGKWANVRKGLRVCDGPERATCAAACGGESKVTRCTVNRLFEASVTNGVTSWGWVDKGVNCRCKNDDDSTSWRCDNCVKVLVFVASLGLFLLQCAAFLSGRGPAPAH